MIQVMKLQLSCLSVNGLLSLVVSNLFLVCLLFLLMSYILINYGNN
jgi:hypothetical protein